MLALLKTPNIFRQNLVTVQKSLNIRNIKQAQADFEAPSVLINFQESKSGQSKIEVVITAVFKVDDYPYCYFVEDAIVHGRIEQKNKEVVWSNGRISIIRDYNKFIDNTQFLVNSDNENRSIEIFNASFLIFKNFVKNKEIEDDGELEYFYSKFTLGEKIEHMVEGSDSDNLRLVAKKKLQNLSIELFDKLKTKKKLVDPNIPYHEPHWEFQTPQESFEEHQQMSQNLNSQEFDKWLREKNTYLNWKKSGRGSNPLNYKIHIDPDGMQTFTTPNPNPSIYSRSSFQDFADMLDRLKNFKP